MEASDQLLNIPLSKDREACYTDHLHPRLYLPILVRMRNRHIRRPPGPLPN